MKRMTFLSKLSKNEMLGLKKQNTVSYEVNREIYDNLKTANGWNRDGDIVLNGKKYRRLKSSEATYTFKSDKDNSYRWGLDHGTDNYHYFRYDPIKWRVLNVSGNAALLLADKALDCRRYHCDKTAVTWETSEIRSFLNGYGLRIIHWKRIIIKNVFWTWPFPVKKSIIF